LKRYPAIEVSGAPLDLILASALDFGVTAAEESGPLVRLFFPTSAARDAAQAALADTWNVIAIDVPDEDWARRSQENLSPVTVGSITVVPCPDLHAGDSPSPSPVTIVIQPSMGFGTGHHATTRLCLAALQTMELQRKSVLDVGTGSGVLAIAADRLGAVSVLGIDFDPDAIESARENLRLNPAVRQTAFEIGDLMVQALTTVDIVTANLTGPLLIRCAQRLAAAVRSGGSVIVSGLLAEERHDVCRAFRPASVVWEREEDGWIGLVFTR